MSKLSDKYEDFIRENLYNGYIVIACYKPHLGIDTKDIQKALNTWVSNPNQVDAAHINVVSKRVGTAFASVKSFYSIAVADKLREIVNILKSGGVKHEDLAGYVTLLYSLEYLLERSAYIINEFAIKSTIVEPTDEEKDIAIAKQIAEKYGYVIAKLV